MTRVFVVILAFASLLSAADTQNKPPAPIPNRPITTSTRMDLIRGLQSEFVFLKVLFPMGKEGLKLRDGRLSPDDVGIRNLIANNGLAGRPGDRGQITNILIRDRSIVFELNGGPKKKKKWYQHLEVGVGANTVPVAPDNSEMAVGSVLTLEFDKFVPDLTVEQAKRLLAPVFDFTARSASQVFVESLPPKLKDAIANHHVLVGMNRELVNAARGRPDQKVREREAGAEYEEWIYGQPPQEVEFVRFTGDEVTQVKTMKVNGEKILRTQKEIDVATALAQHRDAQATEGQPGGAADLSSDPAPGDKSAPAKKPTLRRQGEEAPPDKTPDTVSTPPPPPRPQEPQGPPPNPPR
ncbi:MAG TPA: hypothetical protein VFA60_15590 [Terriglobales bacterium]|nr:hypothetical protein [Terriglobales bacterium]